MKRIALIFCLLFSMVMADQTMAQLSKKEAKEWKKKQKSLSPEEFKNLSEENEGLKSQISSLNGQVSSFQSRLSDKDARIAELQESLQGMEMQVAEAKRQAQAAIESANASKTITPEVINDEVGVVFRVQIGAFKEADLSRFGDVGENFSDVTNDEGLQVITLGSFKDYWEADKFKKNLRRMGVKDAWIVPYKDGVRVAMKDVLEGVVK